MIDPIQRRHEYLLTTTGDHFDMDLKRMRYFCAVVEEGQVSRAARRLHMAQPPLSQRLRELEEEIGYPLLERQGRTLRVTDAGQVFYRRARDILRAVDATCDEVVRVAAQSGPTLRIGVSPTCRSYWMSHFDALRERFPGYRIGAVVGDSSSLEALLRSGKLDLALMQPPLEGDDFIAVCMAASRSVAVMPRGLLDPGDTPLTLAELGRHPLLLLRRSTGVGSYERLLQAFHEARIEVDVALYCSDVEVLLDLLAQGFAGIAVVPESETAACTPDRGRGFDVRPIDVDLPDYQFALVSRRANRDEALIERVVACWRA